MKARLLFLFRQWPRLLLMAFSCLIFTGLGVICDVLFFRWRGIIRRELGADERLPSLSELMRTQVESNQEVFVSFFMSFAALMLLWWVILIVFRPNDTRWSGMFLYGFIVVWLLALSSLTVAIVAAVLPFAVDLQRSFPPPPALFSRIAWQLPSLFLFIAAGLSVFGILRSLLKRKDGSIA